MSRILTATLILLLGSVSILAAQDGLPYLRQQYGDQSHQGRQIQLPPGEIRHAGRPDLLRRDRRQDFSGQQFAADGPLCDSSAQQAHDIGRVEKIVPSNRLGQLVEPVCRLYGRPGRGIEELHALAGHSTVISRMSRMSADEAPTCISTGFASTIHSLRSTSQYASSRAGSLNSTDSVWP